jgi:hypothetical protein
MPEIANNETKAIPMFRFYFDGLIVHIHRTEHSLDYLAELGDMVVGNSNSLTVATVEYSASLQKLNLDSIKAEAENYLT